MLDWQKQLLHNANQKTGNGIQLAKSIKSNQQESNLDDQDNQSRTNTPIKNKQIIDKNKKLDESKLPQFLKNKENATPNKSRYGPKEEQNQCQQINQELENSIKDNNQLKLNDKNDAAGLKNSIESRSSLVRTISQPQTRKSIIIKDIIPKKEAELKVPEKNISKTQPTSPAILHKNIDSKVSAKNVIEIPLSKLIQSDRNDDPKNINQLKLTQPYARNIQNNQILTQSSKEEIKTPSKVNNLINFSQQKSKDEKKTETFININPSKGSILTSNTKSPLKQPQKIDDLFKINKDFGLDKFKLDESFSSVHSEIKQLEEINLNNEKRNSNATLIKSYEKDKDIFKKSDCRALEDYNMKISPSTPHKSSNHSLKKEIYSKDIIEENKKQIVESITSNKSNVYGKKSSFMYNFNMKSNENPLGNNEHGKLEDYSRDIKDRVTDKKNEEKNIKFLDLHKKLENETSKRETINIANNFVSKDEENQSPNRERNSKEELTQNKNTTVNQLNNSSKCKDDLKNNYLAENTGIKNSESNDLLVSSKDNNKNSKVSIFINTNMKNVKLKDEVISNKSEDSSSSSSSDSENSPSPRVQKDNKNKIFNLSALTPSAGNKPKFGVRKSIFGIIGKNDSPKNNKEINSTNLNDQSPSRISIPNDPNSNNLINLNLIERNINSSRPSISQIVNQIDILNKQNTNLPNTRRKSVYDIKGISLENKYNVIDDIIKNPLSLSGTKQGTNLDKNESKSTSHYGAKTIVAENEESVNNNSGNNYDLIKSIFKSGFTKKTIDPKTSDEGINLFKGLFSKVGTAQIQNDQTSYKNDDENNNKLNNQQQLANNNNQISKIQTNNNSIIQSSIQGYASSVPNSVPSVPNSVPIIPRCIAFETNSVTFASNLVPSVPNSVSSIPSFVPSVPNSITSIPRLIPNVPNYVPLVPNSIPLVPNSVATLNNSIPSVPNFVSSISAAPKLPGVPNLPIGAIPGAVPRIPGGIPSIPGGVPRIPGGIPGIPGGVPSIPGGVPSIKVSVPSIPGGIPGFPGRPPGIPGGAPGIPGRPPGIPGGLRMPGAVQGMFQSKVPVKEKVKSNTNMKPLYWNMVDPKKIQNTAWEKLDDKSEIKMINVSKFEEEFSLKKKIEAVSPDSTPVNKKPEILSNLPPSRQQNINMVLAKLKLNYAQVVGMLKSYDPIKLNQSTCELLLQIMPQDSELSMIRGFEDISVFSECDKFVYYVGEVPGYDLRIKSILFKNSFDSQMTDISQRINSFLNVLNTFRNDNRIFEWLQIILAYGNYLNGTSNRGGAFGFKLETLNKITEIKSNDNKKTLLNFIIEWLIDNNRTELVNFKFKQDNEDISIQTIVDLFKDLKKGFQCVSKLLEISESITNKKDDKTEEFLQKFYPRALNDITNCEKEIKLLDEKYEKVCVFYGENIKDVPFETFMEIFNKFFANVKVYKIFNYLESKRRNYEAKRAARKTQKT